MVMVTLFCAVVGEGVIVPVEIEDDKSVGILKEAIATKTKYCLDKPHELTLYMAKKNGGNEVGGAWMHDDDEEKEDDDEEKEEEDDWMKYNNADLVQLQMATIPEDIVKKHLNSDRLLNPTWSIRKYFTGVPTEDVIHVLVQLPKDGVGGVEEAMSHTDASSLYKRKRWESINQMIQMHKKSKPTKQGEISIPYSDVKWSDLEPLYRSFLKPFILKPIPIAQPEVDALYSCLERFTKVFGGVFSGKESKRLFFIAPVLAYVSHMFEDVRLLVEENVDGRQVQANGRFEFVICRGDKRIGIVEAKKDDMEQGMAQNLLGCEVLSDVEQLPVVFGIVTNYTQWIFFRSETDCIYEHDATIDLGEKGMPTKKSLKKIAGMIYSLLV